MMTEREYAKRGLEFSREAEVLEGLHNYFAQHVARLHKTSQLFGLYEGNLGDVLDIGPFYSYTPFVLRSNAETYTVLEGDDPAVYPLKPLYAKHKVAFEPVDLFEIFGPTRGAAHAFNYPDASFDTILCWETMEHFNFNPVKFVRELHRMLRPGGRACITVPNRASFQNLAGLLLGHQDRELIDGYFKFEDYTSNGKKAFYGFHWHEYTVTELRQLFARAGFRVSRCNTMVAFQGHTRSSFARKMLRGANRLAVRIFPRLGTHVFLEAGK